MDQSTQVNFPIVVKKIKRQHTVADFSSHKNSNSLLLNQNMKTGQYRPKSMDSSKFLIYSENQLTKLSMNDLQFLNLPIQQLTPSISISRERTPPFSSNSSITSNNSPSLNKFLNPSKLRSDEASGLNSQCCCRCNNNHNNNNNNNNNDHNNNNNVDDNCYSKLPADDTKSLSWRRLHMSRAKLKATSTTSELLSGFAMIAMVELQINEPTNVPEWLFITFAICTTILVAIHIFALMISTYILPNIDAIAKLDVCDMVTESPHERMRGFIELAWAFSTVLGLFLFLVEVAILCWVKFWDYSFTAATAATIIVIPVLIIFVLFAVHFYHSLVVHKCDTSINDMEQLENMKRHLDQVTSPV